MWNGKADDMSTVVSEQAAKRWAEVKHLPMRAGEMAISAPRAGRSEAETLTPCPTPKPKTRATSQARNGTGDRGAAACVCITPPCRKWAPDIGQPGTRDPAQRNIFPGQHWRLEGPDVSFLPPRLMSTPSFCPLDVPRASIKQLTRRHPFSGSKCRISWLNSFREQSDPCQHPHQHLPSGAISPRPLLPNRYTPRRSLKSHHGVLFLGFPFRRPRYTAVRPRPPIRWIRPGPSPCLPSSVVGPRPQLLPR